MSQRPRAIIHVLLPAALSAVVLLSVASCSSDSAPPPDSEVVIDQLPAGDKLPCGPATCAKGCCSSGTCVTPPRDTNCGTGGAACVDCTPKGLTCSGTGCVAQCKFETGCADSTKYCNAGNCVPCSGGTFNCDLTSDCECPKGCLGTKCR